ncbi:hypothetical protein CC86DRAFT_4251 [Ophiobolus disseminans]|uniref:Uncharacterized protein n=1 Tax=Ophiobolus disseminans TaxID=1469910 RepID=A0A6A7AJB2_9PLEO|nr:hypothetical protein CC86DRAFT_4251 [Ophiobolus disseminans]
MRWKSTNVNTTRMQGKGTRGPGEENFRLAQRHARTQMPWLAACVVGECAILKQHRFRRCTTPARLCLARRAIECQHSSHASQLVNATPSRPIARAEVGSISVALTPPVLNWPIVAPAQRGSPSDGAPTHLCNACSSLVHGQRIPVQNLQPVGGRP